MGQGYTGRIMVRGLWSEAGYVLYLFLFLWFGSGLGIRVWVRVRSYSYLRFGSR